MKSIIELQPINNGKPGKINEFYEKLTTRVQVLETMGKIKTINDYGREVSNIGERCLI